MYEWVSQFIFTQSSYSHKHRETEIASMNVLCCCCLRAQKCTLNVSEFILGMKENIFVCRTSGWLAGWLASTWTHTHTNVKAKTHEESIVGMWGGFCREVEWEKTVVFVQLYTTHIRRNRFFPHAMYYKCEFHFFTTSRGSAYALVQFRFFSLAYFLISCRFSIVVDWICSCWWCYSMFCRFMKIIFFPACSNV